MLTLRQRLIFSHILPVLLLAPVLGFLLVFVLERRVILVNLSAQLDRQAELLAEASADRPEIWSDPTAAQAFVARYGQRTLAQVMLLDGAGRVLASSDPADAALIGRVLDHPELLLVQRGGTSSRTDYSQVYSAEIADILVPVWRAGSQPVGIVRLTQQLETVSERFERLRFLIIQVLALGLALGGLAAMLLAWSLERPVGQLTQAISRLASGDELQPLDEKGPAEFRLLAVAFNNLVERLTILRLARRQLLANLVHELGRPLGALRSASQALLDGADEEAELRAQLLRGMDGELRTLQRLLDDLVGYYDQAVGALDLDRQPLQPAEWLASLAAPWGEAAQQRGLRWETAIAPDLPRANVDADRLGQAVGNLLHNAIKFTPAGGQVILAAGVEKEAWWMRISDSGPGIAPAERARIFEPFFRSRARERLPEGMGLGLTIARDLVAAHGGRLEVTERAAAGSAFTIWLPLDESEQA